MTRHKRYWLTLSQLQECLGPQLHSVVEAADLNDLIEGIWECVEEFRLFIIWRGIVAVEWHDLGWQLYEKHWDDWNYCINVAYLVVEPMHNEHSVKLSCKRLPGMRLVVTGKLPDKKATVDDEPQELQQCWGGNIEHVPHGEDGQSRQRKPCGLEKSRHQYWSEHDPNVPIVECK